MARVAKNRRSELSAALAACRKAFVAVEVTSSGGRIPRYAGNLDIINSAALYAAECYAADRLSVAATERS